MNIEEKSFVDVTDGWDGLSIKNTVFGIDYPMINLFVRK